MPLKWKSKVLLAKVETTYGTDPTPTGALNAILATEVRLTPMEGQDVSRNLELPYMGAQPSIPTELHQRLSFRVELTPSGTAGTPPPWGVLLRGCAVAEVITATTSVAYNPVTNGHESVTLYLWIDSTLYKMSGARGTAVLRVNAQGIVYLEFDFTGLFTLPTETPQATPTLAAQIGRKPKVATTANTPVFTIGGSPLVMRSFALNLGNQVETRFLIGSESVLITDKAETIETTVEAVPLTTLNPFELAYEQTTGAVALITTLLGGALIQLSTGADPATAKVRVYRSTSPVLNRETDAVGEPYAVGPMQSYSIALGDTTRSNLLTDGGFDNPSAWTHGTGWAVADSEATHTPGTADDIGQALAAQVGKFYRISFDTSEVTAGTVTPWLIGGSDRPGTPVSTSGLQVQRIQAVTGNASIAFRATSAFDGTLDGAVAYMETEASLSQGTHYVWIEPVNADDMPGAASGPFTITIV